MRSAAPLIWSGPQIDSSKVPRLGNWPKNGDKEAVGGVLYTAAELIRITSILLYPIMPQKMKEIRAVFGLDDSTLTLDSARTWFDLPGGNKINLSGSIFPRLDVKKMPSLVKPEKAEVTEDGLISIDDFGQVDLRVARVDTAERVEKADKLLKLQITIGDKKRQIIAGIAEHYAPENLIGKNIIVVANLKPAKIRGIESDGMLLAARKDGKLTLVTTDEDIVSGASVG